MRTYTPEQRQRQKEWRARNREAAKAYASRYYADNKNALDAYRKSHYQTVRRGITLKHKYGIGLDDYNKMFSEQEGRCKICQTHQSELKVALNVDHDHTTGNVRALLCSGCNAALGGFKDKKELLHAAITYLESYENHQNN